MGVSTLILTFRRLLPTAGFLLIALAICRADQHPMDQVVLQRIEKQLQSDIRLRDAALDIEVMAGQVTLQGQLPSFVDRNRVERICRRMDGVNKVTNRITIAPALNDEASLRRAVEVRLAAEPDLRASRIQVETDGTIITLRGGVDSLFARRWAERLAEQVRGVSRVRNELKLDQPELPPETLPDRQLQDSIKKTLEKDARSLATPIQITVREGVVTLDGEVDSPSRRRFYRHLVERIPGVQGVLNRLEVRLGEGSGSESTSVQEAAWDIQLALEAAQPVGSQPQVKLADDTISITGAASSLLQKQQILRLAQAFAAGYPVIDAMNVIDVEQSAADFQAELLEWFRGDVMLADAPIEVNVDQQVATLTGTVERFADKLRAERLASRVAGIREINNQLVVKWMAMISDQELKTRIRQRLQRNRWTADAVDAIEVTVQDGRVTLEGKVPSPDTRREIAAVVANTDGIRSVENRIETTPDD